MVVMLISTVLVESADMGVRLIARPRRRSRILAKGRDISPRLMSRPLVVFRCAAGDPVGVVYLKLTAFGGKNRQYSIIENILII